MIKYHMKFLKGSNGLLEYPKVHLIYILSCHVFYGRRKMMYFEKLFKKVAKRVMNWQNRLLTFGRRYILIRHVLQFMSIYLLFDMNPSKKVIEQLHKIFSKFFGGSIGEIKGKHWVIWKKLCYPKKVRLHLRSLHDVATTHFSKL